MGKPKKQKIVVGNLKLHLTTLRERDVYIAGIRSALTKVPTEMQDMIVICPPTIHFASFANLVRTTGVKLGAQDIYWESEGPYVSETSAQMVREMSGDYVIVGHSNRRQRGETIDDVARKTAHALREQITPVVCIGYTEEGRDMQSVIAEEISQILAVCDKEECTKIIFVYEPTWAIGGGKAPTAAHIQEMALEISDTIKKAGFDPTQFRILYGGSVTPENVEEVCIEAGVDGVLVGGASLDPEKLVLLARILNS